MQQFISVKDVPRLGQWIEDVKQLKKNPYNYKSLGENKVLGLVFFNQSLRTRMSMQRAAFNLGMQVMVLNVGQDSWQLEMNDGTIMDGGTQEHVKEAVAVISQYCDIIGVRSFPGLKDREMDYQEEILTNFIRYSTVPVISLESATSHPLQGFADLLTIEEYKKTARPKVVLSWAPHPKALPQAVPNTFVEWMRAADMDLVVTHPEGYELSEKVMGNTRVEYDQQKAFKGADFIYAKNWSSFKEYGKILSKSPDWMITQEKMQLTNGARFMHCLPIRRNVIAEDSVVDESIVIPQAANRLFTAQLVLKKMLESLP